MYRPVRKRRVRRTTNLREKDIEIVQDRTRSWGESRGEKKPKTINASGVEAQKKR